jgi:hypothetical protein
VGRTVGPHLTSHHLTYYFTSLFFLYDKLAS